MNSGHIRDYKAKHYWYLIHRNAEMLKVSNPTTMRNKAYFTKNLPLLLIVFSRKEKTTRRGVQNTAGLTHRYLCKSVLNFSTFLYLYSVLCYVIQREIDYR